MESRGRLSYSLYSCTNNHSTDGATFSFGFLLRGFRFDGWEDWFGEDWGWEEIPIGLATFAFDTFFAVFFTEIFPIASLLLTNRQRVFPSTWIFL